MAIPISSARSESFLAPRDHSNRVNKKRKAKGRGTGSVPGVRKQLPKNASKIPEMRKTKRLNSDVLTACDAWIHKNPGKYPRDKVIHRLGGRYHAPSRTLRKYFDRTLLKTASHQHAPVSSDHELVSCYRSNWNKCKADPDWLTSLERKPDRSFVCTRRCGLTFGARKQWIRHEETNWVQHIWKCRFPGCQPLRPSTRLDHFQKHLKSSHGNEYGTKQDLEDSHIPITNNFPKACIFHDCPTTFESWKNRNKHVGDHLESDWNVSQWRNLEDDTVDGKVMDDRTKEASADADADEEESSSSQSENSSTSTTAGHGSTHGSDDESNGPDDNPDATGPNNGGHSGYDAHRDQNPEPQRFYESGDSFGPNTESFFGFSNYLSRQNLRLAPNRESASKSVSAKRAILPLSTHARAIGRHESKEEMREYMIEKYFREYSVFKTPSRTVQREQGLMADVITATDDVPAVTQTAFSGISHLDVPNYPTLANTNYTAASALLSPCSQPGPYPGAEDFRNVLASDNQEALLSIAQNATPYLAGPFDTAVDVPEEAARRPAETSYSAVGCIHHVHTIRESEIINYFNGNRRKCTRDRGVQGRLRKNPAKPYTCTSRCGQMFSKKGHWIRHEEENNYAQKVWICSCDKCRSKSLDERAHFRKDHVEKHAQRVHNTKSLDRHVTEHLIPNNYSRHCFLKQCHEEFDLWSSQCEHIAEDMRLKPWDILEWRLLGDGIEHNAHNVTESSSSEESGQDSSSGNNRSSQDGSESGAEEPGPTYKSGTDRDPGPNPDNHSTSNQQSRGVQGSEGQGLGYFAYAFERRSGTTIHRSTFNLDVLRLDLIGPFETSSAELRPGNKRLDDEHHSSDRQSSVELKSDHQESTTHDQSTISSRKGVPSDISTAKGKASTYTVTTNTSLDQSFCKVTAGPILGSSRRHKELSFMERYLADYDPLQRLLVTGQLYRPKRNSVLRNVVANFDQLFAGDTELLSDTTILMDLFSDLASFKPAIQTWSAPARYVGGAIPAHPPCLSQNASCKLGNKNGLAAEGTHDRVIQFPHYTIRDKIRASKAPYNNLFCSDINFGIPACASEVQSCRTSSTHTENTSLCSQETTCKVDRRPPGFMLQRFIDQHPTEEPFSWFLAGVRLDVDLSRKKPPEVDEWLSRLE